MASKVNILWKKEKRKGRPHKRELDIPGKKLQGIPGRKERRKDTRNASERKQAGRKKDG